MSDPAADYGYCAAELRRHDNGRFLTAQFAEPDRRPGLMALYAFNLEIGRVRESAREPLLGMVRLQWWRDALAMMERTETPKHAVALALAETIGRFGLDRAALVRLVDARESDLGDTPPDDLPSLRLYAEATGGALAELALGILGDTTQAARDAARHAGCALALAGSMRSLAVTARLGRCMLPAAVMDRAGVRLRDVLDLRSTPELADAVRMVVICADDALGDMRRALPRPSRLSMPALLAGTLARVHLAALRKAGYDPLDRRLLAPDKLRLVTSLLAASALRRP